MPYKRASSWPRGGIRSKRRENNLRLNGLPKTSRDARKKRLSDKKYFLRGRDLSLKKREKHAHRKMVWEGCPARPKMLA